MPGPNQSSISLVVVDAIDYDIEDGGSLTLPNIQQLVDYGLTTRVYELFAGTSGLRHDGKKIKRTDNTPSEIEKIASEIVPGDIVLVGGSLGNSHYMAFVTLLDQIRKTELDSTVHIPFDCTYSFIHKSDSGEGWKEGLYGNAQMPVFNLYREAMAKYGQLAQVIEPGKEIPPVSMLRLHLWNEWQKMAGYLIQLHAD